MTLQDIIDEVCQKLPEGYTVKIEISSEGAGVVAVLSDGYEMMVVADDITQAVMDAAGCCEGDAEAKSERN